MDDHFEHSALIPQEPATYRRAPVVLAAAVVIILGVLTVMYWQQLTAIPSWFSSGLGNQTRREAQPPTLEEKVKLLQADTNSNTSASSTPPPPTQTKAALLKGDSSAKSATVPHLSAEEKAKLLSGQ